ncbi:hypothetical protein GC163_01070 [bacterium]|nr:hypothetical protein [bacterium]
MPVTTESELQSFQRFLTTQLLPSTGDSLSPEEAVQLWREREASLQALRDSLAEIDSHQTIDIEEFDRQFRERNTLRSV